MLELVVVFKQQHDVVLRGFLMGASHMGPLEQQLGWLQGVLGFPWARQPPSNHWPFIHPPPPPLAPRVQSSLHVDLSFLDIISPSVLQTLDSSLTLILLSLSQLVKTQPLVDITNLVTDDEVGDEEEVAVTGPGTQDGGRHGLTLVAGPT